MSTVRKNGTAADRSWLWFAAWTVVGTGWCLALATVMTIGPVFVAPVVLVLTVLLLVALRRGSAVGLPGLLSGPAAVLFLIGYLNRGGPGPVCSTTATGGEGCTDAWDPAPFLAAGSLFLVAGVVLFLVVRRKARRQDAHQGPTGNPVGPWQAV
jgi:hypothetical protein